MLVIVRISVFLSVWCSADVQMRPADVSGEPTTYIFGVVMSPTPFKMETIRGYLQALSLIYQAVRRCIPEIINHHTQISTKYQR